MTYYDLITLPLSLLGINTVILWLTQTSGDTSQLWDFATLVISITVHVKLLITKSCSYKNICTFPAMSQISYLHFSQFYLLLRPGSALEFQSHLHLSFSEVTKAGAGAGVDFTLPLKYNKSPPGIYRLPSQSLLQSCFGMEFHARGEEFLINVVPSSHCYQLVLCELLLIVL